jgi:ATP-dependent DNA helicase RecQ
MEKIYTLWDNCASAEGETLADPVTQAAERVFGIKYLYPWQRLVIANILDAAHFALQTRPPLAAPQETGDSDQSTWARQIVLLPTGAGKSLCFLLPAAMLDRPTLVIYPLLALMADQKRRMDAGSLEAVVFRGGQSDEEREENFRRIAAGAKIILANPEVLQSDKLCERLAKCGIIHAAIDEAHCTAEWGDSFRPAYLKLGEILKKLNVPVITAFTATASESVLRRAAEVLFDGEAHLVRSDSDRPNLRYRLHFAYAKEKAALKLAITAEKPLIVFCGTRIRAETCARLFGAYFGRETVRFYHAGLDREEKTAVEKWFFPKTDAILCATCAFGMGVDKADVRTVIHLDPPSTAEAYIQEAGRGGRDGAVSQAILLWGPADHRKALESPPGSRGRVLADFAERGTCRRQILLDALGGEQAACSGCDVCDGTAETGAADAQETLRFFRHNVPMDAHDAAELLQHRFNKIDALALGMRIWEYQDFRGIIEALIHEGRLRSGRGFSRDKLRAAEDRS